MRKNSVNLPLTLILTSSGFQLRPQSSKYSSTVSFYLFNLTLGNKSGDMTLDRIPSFIHKIIPEPSGCHSTQGMPAVKKNNKKKKNSTVTSFSLENAPRYAHRHNLCALEM